MNIDQLETEIRRTLDAQAYEVDVPEGLATRTLAALDAEQRRSLRDRMRAWRDARQPVTGYPRWMYGLATAGATVLLFTLGALVTNQIHLPQRAQQSTSAGATLYTSHADVDQSGSASSGDSVAGSVTGVVSSGDARYDATNRSDRVALQRSATIRVAVKHFDETWRAANDVARKYGGDVTGSRTKQIGSRSAEGTVTMRVPSSKLDAVLSDLRALGTLARLETNGDDIAQQIDDAKANVEASKTTDEKLGAEKALRALQREVEFATVEATIYQSAAAKADDSMLGGAMNTAGRVGLTVIAGLLVLLAAVLPLGALATAGWFAARAVRTRTRS
jgi:hypothetical protein